MVMSPRRRRFVRSVAWVLAFVAAAGFILMNALASMQIGFPAALLILTLILVATASLVAFRYSRATESPTSDG